MKKYIAKRSLSALLSLLLLITACGVSGASAATWVPELGAGDGSSAGQAVVENWTDQDFANWDGEFLGDKVVDRLVTGGDLASLDYTVDETDTVGVRVYATSDTINEFDAAGNTFSWNEEPTFYFPKPDWQEGNEIRFYYEVYLEGIDQATTTYLNDDGGKRYGMMADVFTKSGKGIQFTPPHNAGSVSSWTGFNGEAGIYNFDGTTKTFSNNGTYGYSAKTVYTSPATVPSGWIEDEYFIRIFPTHIWDYQNNPYRIYAFGIQKLVNDSWTTIARYSGEQLLSIVERQNTQYPNSHIKCEPIEMKKVNRTAVGGADGPYEIAGRTTTGNGHFHETRRYFLYDDFAYYLNESGRQTRQVDALCNDLQIGHILGVDFTLAFPAGFNPAVFDTSKFQVVLRGRHTVTDYDQIALLNFGSEFFKTMPRTSYQVPCTYDVTVTKGSTTLNDQPMDTYRFQIDIANVTQNTLDKLNAGTPTASDAQNSLNLLLGTEEGYSHSQNPITLIHWSLKNHHTNTVYIDREGVELGQNYWAGSGPAWKFAYKTLKPTYKPNLMVNTYIPKGRVFTGFDSGADGAFTLPHKGEYALKFTVKGEAGYGYTAALLRKTKGKGVLTQAYDDFIATGEKQVITVPFYGEDLDDTYTFQLNGGALYPNTTNGRGDEKLLVYGVQLVTDAVAKIGEVTYPDLDWALKDAAASGETVTLLTEVEYTRSNVLSVPAGVTLDLAGYNLKAKNLVSFGQVIDGNVGGKGSLTLVDRQGQATQDAVADLQVNNTFMPLYDSANQCYRFYDYEIVNAGCKPTGKANEIKYGYKLRFYDVSAFELLAKGDTGVVVVADVHWDDCGFEYRHTISAATLKSYAENVKTKLQNTPMDSIGTAMALTVSKVNHIGAGNSIYSTPTVFSELTGVSGTGTESSYTYNKA